MTCDPFLPQKILAAAASGRGDSADAIVVPAAASAPESDEGIAGAPFLANASVAAVSSSLAGTSSRRHVVGCPAEEIRHH